MIKNNEKSSSNVIKKIFTIIIITVVSFATFFSFCLYYKYLNNEKKDEAVKDEIEVEIIDKEDGFVEKIADKEINKEVEENIIENDAEQVEITEEDIYLEEPEEVIKNSSIIPATLPLPVFRKNNPDELRIGFITDLHVGSSVNGVGDGVLRLDFVDKINYFIEKMNNSFVPNFIITGGDIIEGTKVSLDKGMTELSLVRKLFDRTTLKKYWVVGNHDLRSVKKKQFMQSLDIDYVSKAFVVGNYKIIILDSNFTKDDEDVIPGGGYTRGHISEEQIEFLEKELKNIDKRVIVFLHHPPLWSIDGKSNFAFPDNAKRLQEIFSQNKVFVVFAGHIEDLFLQEIDGVKYFISPGILKNEKYQGTFSEITIKKGKMIIDMNYLKSDGNYRTIRIKEE